MQKVIIKRCNLHILWATAVNIFPAAFRPRDYRLFIKCRWYSARWFNVDSLSGVIADIERWTQAMSLSDNEVISLIIFDINAMTSRINWPRPTSQWPRPQPLTSNRRQHPTPLHCSINYIIINNLLLLFCFFVFFIIILLYYYYEWVLPVFHQLPRCCHEI